MAEIYKELIPFEGTGVLNKTVKDYYSGSEALKKFYQYSPSLNDIEKAISNRKAFPLYRDVVSKVLVKQYEALSKSDNFITAQSQIQLLKEQNTFTVTTAHQPNLLLGPLYYIYKIASIIKFTQILKAKFPAYNFIPVFWMGSEDHDTEELAHINLFGKKIEWKTTHDGAFGLKPLDSIADFKAELKSVLGDSQQAAHILQMLEGNYFNEKNISSATKKMLHNLFGKHGLLVIDGNDAELKALFAPAIKDELLHQSAFNLVNSTVKEMEQAGYVAQAHAREVNLFYLEENLRQRIVFENNTYKVFNTNLSFSTDEILQLLQSHPERFSPNVILRPVYQEAVLPNIAFIGGGAEVSYMLQLQSLFNHHKVHYPTVLLRDIVLLLEENSMTRIHKLGFELKDIFQNKEELINKYLAKNASVELNLDSTKDSLRNLYNKIDAGVKLADASLSGAVQAELTKTLKGIEAIEEKLRRAEKRKNETIIQQIEKLKEKLFPSNNFQERYTNFLEYYLVYEDDFIPMLLENINLLELGVKAIIRKN